MNKGILKWGIIASLSILCFYGCVEDLSLDSQTSNYAVVNCVLTNNDVQYLSLTQSVSLDGSYVFKEIKDATIILFEQADSVGIFERKGYDDWQIKFHPKPDKLYKLEVHLSNKSILTASTKMPSDNQIKSNIEGNIFPTKYFTQLSANNPCWIFVFASDEIFADTIAPSTRILRSQLGTDHALVDNFNRDGNLLDFLPEGTTPAYNYYIRINPSETNTEAGWPFCIQTSFGLNSMVFFRTASIEYDKYLKTSLEKMDIYTDEDDPARWFDESSIYSNINNGLGIFAAYSDVYFYYNDSN